MKIRSFIAVDPPPEVLDKIADMIESLEKQTRGMRWVNPDGIHLTLRFLGEVDEEVFPEIESRLKQLALGEGPISLTASGLGFFPDPARPRIVWVGLGGETDRLESLGKKVNEAFRDLPVHPEEAREFKPHITVARIADHHRASGIARILEKGKGAQFGSFSVNTLILYKSNLTPDGARYTKLKEFKLGRQ